MAAPLFRMLMLAATFVLIVVEAAADRAWSSSPAGYWMVMLGVAVSWSVVGALAWSRRPRSGIGRLMMVFAMVVAANGPGLRTSAFAAALLTTLSGFAFGVLPAVGAHVIIAFPSGRLSKSLDRVFVRAGYLWGVLDGVRITLTGIRGRGREGPWAQSLLHVDLNAAAVDALGGAAVVGWLLFQIGFVVLLVRRVIRAGHRERMVLTFPIGAVAVTVAMLMLRQVWVIGNHFGLWHVSEPPLLIPLVIVAATIAAPVAFLVGLLRERLAYASVADLVRVVERVPADQVEPALASALGDPGLRLVFPVAGGYVDTQGRPVPQPAAGRGTTPVGDAAAPVAVLVHDPMLGEEAALVQAAAAAVRLALDNARLQAEVKAQLAEVRASRARLVSAGDAARRRLERDLHDGAQQRLLAAGLAVRMLRQSLPHLGGDGHDLLADAEAELRAALHELRELARGIHPAILTNQGLRAAVDQLADRCALPVVVTGDPGRLAAPIEATAYFVVNEAIANIVKHARAAQVTVDLQLVAGRLQVCVADDGVGGADPASGSGLTGLADRVASVEGTLTVISPPGGGTRIVADLPAV